MKAKKITSIIMAALITAAMLTACSAAPQTDAAGETNASISQSTDSADDTKDTLNDKNETSDETTGKESETGEEEYFSKRDLSNDYDKTNAVKITLNGTSINVSGDGAAAEKNVLTISKEGVYIISGTLSDGRIIVSAGDSDKVQLVLGGCSVTCSDNSPIFVESADKVFVTTAKGTTNTITDGKTYNSAAEESGADSAIYSKTDLVINGSGTLNVTGNYSHAIVSKDDLKITGGTISAVSAKSAVSGKDSVRIANADITITSGADAIKSSNDEDLSKGYIYIESGTINITSDGDAFSASSDIIIEDGTVKALSGGGYSKSTNTHENDFMFGRNNTASANTEDDTESTKGLKADGSITIKGGTIDLDCADDSVNAGSNVTISGGNLTFASGDDGIHADEAVTISNGTLVISESYEGIEAKSITVSGGSVELKSEDDGFNATDGESEGGMGGMGGIMQNDAASSDVFILISGGTVSVNADGDGIDSNGTLTVSGGTIYVDGPTNSGNGALDAGSGSVITGGTVIAVGSSGMAETFGSTSTQGSILYNLDETHSADEKITLKDENGKELITYTAKKTFNSVVISTPEITSSGTYTLTVGSKDYSIEMTSISYSNGGSMMGGPGGGMGNPGNMRSFGNGMDNSGDMRSFGGGMRRPNSSGDGTDGFTPPTFGGSENAPDGFTPPTFGSGDTNSSSKSV